jgi:lipoprotein NlpD
VRDRGTVVNDRLTTHYVSRGETLYSIAWRYGIDYSRLAKRNAITSPFIIYPGQKILLKGYSSVKAKPSKVAAIARVSPPSKPVRSKTTTKKTKSKKAVALPPKGWKWQWPARGKILARYSASSALNKGVDIAGALGQPVVAAAPGVVVYAGSGLRGYGNLLIIKHSERYLSAYAHNNRLLVAEQNVVKAGQQIAEIGSSGTDKSKLHFEIRRDGKPIDPLKYLPRR